MSKALSKPAKHRKRRKRRCPPNPLALPDATSIPENKMTVEELAKALGVADETVERWCKPPGCPHLDGRTLDAEWVRTSSERYPRTIRLLDRPQCEELILRFKNVPKDNPLYAVWKDGAGEWVPLKFIPFKYPDIPERTLKRRIKQGKITSKKMQPPAGSSKRYRILKPVRVVSKSELDQWNDTPRGNPPMLVKPSLQEKVDEVRGKIWAPARLIAMVCKTKPNTVGDARMAGDIDSSEDKPEYNGKHDVLYRCLLADRNPDNTRAAERLWPVRQLSEAKLKEIEAFAPATARWARKQQNVEFTPLPQAPKPSTEARDERWSQMHKAGMSFREIADKHYEDTEGREFFTASWVCENVHRHEQEKTQPAGETPARAQPETNEQKPPTGNVQAGTPDAATIAPATNDEMQLTSIDWQALLLSPPLSAAEIAARLGQPVDLVERTLRYFRNQHDYGFSEDKDAGIGESRFRYRMRDVLSHLQMWIAKRQKKAARAGR